MAQQGNIGTNLGSGLNGKAITILTRQSLLVSPRSKN